MKDEVVSTPHLGTFASHVIASFFDLKGSLCIGNIQHHYTQRRNRARLDLTARGAMAKKKGKSEAATPSSPPPGLVICRNK